MPLLEELLLDVAAYVLGIAEALAHLDFKELLHAVRAVLVLVVVLHKVGEGGKPALLVLAVHHLVGEGLRALLPGDVDALPTLRGGRFDDSLAEREVFVGEHQLATVVGILDFVLVARADFLDGAFAVADAVLPEVEGELAGGGACVVVGHALFDFSLGVFDVTYAEGHELAAACGCARAVVFGACTVVFATVEACHLARAGGEHRLLENEVGHRGGQCLGEVERLACLVHVAVKEGGIERINAFAEAAHLAGEVVHRARHVVGVVCAHAHGVELCKGGITVGLVEA